MLKSRPKYDYIVAGAGCAGLSLIMRMISDPRFANKKILLIDKSAKNKNDRTWCFWEKHPGFFENIVYKRWRRLEFLSNSFSRIMDISPYEYKMIRGIDFYTYCFEQLQRHKNVDIMYGDLQQVKVNEKNVVLYMHGKTLELDRAIVFSSIYFPAPEKTGHIHLWQHFKGWLVQMEEPFFNTAACTLMDFRVTQQHGNSFAYVLPFDKKTALIEYTLFTKDLLKPEQYDKGLREYIENVLGVKQYRIIEEELGKIPMTDERFSFYSNGIFYIGTAGGQTKPSTGYTFNFIQKHADAIMDHLGRGADLSGLSISQKRFRFYDDVLLNILYYNRLSAAEIFADLFKKNQPQRVLKFLDNETTMAEELEIIFTLPRWPFFRAGVKTFSRSFIGSI